MVDIIKIIIWPIMALIGLLLTYRFFVKMKIDNIKLDAKKWTLEATDGDDIKNEEIIRFLGEYRVLVEKICYIRLRKKDREYWNRVKEAVRDIKIQSLNSFINATGMYYTDRKYSKKQEMKRDHALFKNMLNRQSKEIFETIEHYINSNGFYDRPKEKLEQEKNNIIKNIVVRCSNIYNGCYRDRFVIDSKYIEGGNWTKDLVKVLEENISLALEDIFRASKVFQEEIDHYESILTNMSLRKEK